MNKRASKPVKITLRRRECGGESWYIDPDDTGSDGFICDRRLRELELVPHLDERRTLRIWLYRHPVRGSMKGEFTLSRSYSRLRFAKHAYPAFLTPDTRLRIRAIGTKLYGRPPVDGDVFYMVAKEGSK